MISLDTRGIRESHLHIMLQRIEACFKESVRRNQLSHNILDQYRDKNKQEDELNSSYTFENAESPNSAVCTTNFDALEPSISFRIEIGKNEKENNNFLQRYEDLQNWMWKECFNPSIVRALTCGEKRCLPLLGICDICISTYAEDCCTFCLRSQGKIAAKGIYSEQFIDENSSMNAPNSPLRIRLIEAILTSLEVSYSALFCI